MHRLTLATFAFSLISLCAISRAQSYTYTRSFGSGQISCLCLDSKGNIFGSFGQVRGSVRKYDNSGKILTTIGTSGSSALQSPLGVATDTSDNLYVVDNYNKNVVKFDNQGNFLSKFGSNGLGPGQFNDPVRITLDRSGNIYVGDGGNHRVEKFDSNGQFLMQFSTAANSNGFFGYTQGIAVDTSGNIFVAVETNNSSNNVENVQKFDSQGHFLGQIGSVGSGNGLFNQPFGIALDSSDNLFVADYGNNRIDEFDNQGNFLTKFGGIKPANGGLKGVFDVAVDSKGNVYADDIFSSRVVIYAPSVPEPSSLAFLLTMGLTGAILLRRRKR